MDLQPSQNNYNEGDRLQTSESLLGFFFRMTVSNKTMERIMRQDFHLSPYDGFRIGGIGRVLNQIELNQRRHRIIYKVSSGYEILVAGVAGKENGSMTLGLNFLEDHKPWGRKGSGICTTKPGVFPKEAMETLPVITGRDFSQKILILNKGIREAKIMIGGAFGTPWFMDNNRNLLIFTTNCGNETQDKRKFGKALLSFRQQGLIDSDSFYEESKEEIKTLKEALQEIKLLDDRNKNEATLKGKEECKYEYVRYKPIQMNMEDKKDIQGIIKEHINLGRIEPGVSAYSSPGFQIRNHGEIKRGAKVFSKFDCKSGFYQIKMESESKKFIAFSTPQGQYIWNVMPMGLANAPQIFQRKMDNLFKDYFEFMFVYIDDILIAFKNMKDHIKHLEKFSDACHREGLVLSEKKATIVVNKIAFLGILIDETGIKLQDHIVEKIRNFPDVLKDKKHLQSFLGVVNFADDDELVVYTDANDYRWAAVLMKKTTTGEEPCRYTGGLFSEQQA
ncbi:UNVERIFIED_CONTAM: Enzymatic polyprotein [Sesamum latifolium]|uniref:Enzymatic polyprotein n=1 Tax=Sesamum latifolium TaxID=2727402 RepID=A0AAW2UTX1_9LAMI